MAKPKTSSQPKPESDVGPDGTEVTAMPASYDFLRSVQIWQGAPKTGKTSTAAALGPVAKRLGIPEIKPFFMLFEPGSGGVEISGTSEKCGCGGKKGCVDCEGVGIKRKILTTLEDMTKWFTWAGKSKFNPIVLDTGDGMFQVVSDCVCLKMGITNPTQADHGAAWLDIFDEMREKISILTGAGKSVVMLMHVYMMEKRVKGGSIQVATFNVSGKSRQFLAGLANQILHFEVVPDGEGDKHIISTRAKSGVEAGDHWGVMPEELDRGDSPEAAAEAILKCFYEVQHG